MCAQTKREGSALTWLLEEESPGVRYLALRDLEHRPADDRELSEARKLAHRKGPIGQILANMDKAGYWGQPGPGYDPKYRSTVWSIILLAQLGASAKQDARIARACGYVLDHALARGGQFSATGAPSGTADCLQGNLAWALLELGCEDPRLAQAFDWMARTVTGEGISDMSDRKAPLRYYAGKCGPDFACGANNKLPCAWGGVKVMLALGRLPKNQRTPVIERAIRRGAKFLFSVDPADAAYPTGYSNKPSGNWWKLGFPVFYVTDLLQLAEALAAVGYGHDARLKRTLDLLRSKQHGAGRWPLEYEYTGKTWVDFGERGKPNKWVTLRAMRLLQAIA